MRTLVWCCFLMTSVSGLFDAGYGSRYMNRPIIRYGQRHHLSTRSINKDHENNTKMESTSMKQEIATLSRRLVLSEKEYEQCETTLQGIALELEQTSRALDGSEKKRKHLETSTAACKERLSQLNEDLTKAEFMTEAANGKYKDAVKKLATKEVNLERAEAKLDAAHEKINELEEELRVVGNNLKTLEISEEEAAQRELGYEESIKELTGRLMETNKRAETAEATVTKLQKEVDLLEDELLGERMKTDDEQSSPILSEL